MPFYLALRYFRGHVLYTSVDAVFHRVVAVMLYIRSFRSHLSFTYTITCSRTFATDNNISSLHHSTGCTHWQLHGDMGIVFIQRTDYEHKGTNRDNPRVHLICDVDMVQMRIQEIEKTTIRSWSARRSKTKREQRISEGTIGNNLVFSTSYGQNRSECFSSCKKNVEYDTHCNR